MKETIIFYSVSEYSDGYYNKEKMITSLTEAESIAKQRATKEREVFFINSHTLTVLKNFKIEDKPQEANFVHYCHYEGCPKESIKDHNNGRLDSCALHTALKWRNAKTKEDIPTDFNLSVKKIPQKLGEQMLIDVVTLAHEGNSTYNVSANTQNSIHRLNTQLQKYGITMEPFYDGKPRRVFIEGDNSVNVRMIAYIIIEMGGVKFQ